MADSAQQRLTIKQRKWIDLYIELGNATEAAMRVYDVKDRDSAKVIGAENISKLNYAILMEQAGLTDTMLLNKLAEGLEANKQLATRVIFKKDAPTSQSAHELPPATGMTDDFIEVPDYAVRHKYLETAYKLKGRMKNNSEGVEVNGHNIQINVIAGGYVPKSSSTETPPTGSTV